MSPLGTVNHDTPIRMKSDATFLWVSEMRISISESRLMEQCGGNSKRSEIGTPDSYMPG
jgi:hypothetical protein